jgi:hypothetical protein
MIICPTCKDLQCKKKAMNTLIGGVLTQKEEDMKKRKLKFHFLMKANSSW